MTFPEAAEIRGVEVQGQRLYAITVTKLFIFDVSDPASPINLSTTTLPERLNDLQLRAFDLWLVIADTWGDRVLLTVLDTSDPNDVTVKSQVVLPRTRLGRVRMSGDRAFVTVRDELVAEDLRWYEISNPAEEPKVHRVGGLPAFRAWVSGQTAFIATGRRAVSKAAGYYTEVSSVAVVDISHPDDPHTMGYIWAPELASDLAIAGDAVFIIGDGLSRDMEPLLWFYVVDLADPAEPSITHGVRMPGQALQMALLGRYAYIAAGDGGLHVVDTAVPLLVRTLSGSDLRSQ